ncbi:MFS transporter [Phycicoccus flavus]|uniref:MFS transporter n=1 Tax=Phycicoccus flavus TaxID=2502783 RepID=UPI000FEBB8E4|nr:MFS transporter [Phycicoccus flavus]NHA68977.1 MFS transporter [Phycicoccus flavus]
MTATSSPTAPRERLLDRRYLPVVVGVVALVTLAAFENRAVMTILPVVVRDLDGWALFGASTGASLVTFTVATAWSGSWTDRLGPRPVLLAGLGLFVAAQVVSALAPTMPLFVAGRALSGAAEALVDTTLLVLVAQALPESLRAKVFASFAAAWILPSLLGPGLAGAIEGLAGWRFVFLGPLLVVPPALVLLRVALRRGGGPAATSADDPGARGRLGAAVLLAAGLAVTTFSAPLLDSTATRVAGLAVVGAGAVVVVLAATRALPAGTARLAPGVPAVVGLRLLTSAAFTGVGSVLPLMLVTTHDVSTTVAGVSLSVTGVMWAFGSWLNSTGRVQDGVTAAVRTRAGGLLIAVGAAGPVLLALDLLPVAAGMVGWALAATGMGILSPTLSTELLEHAPRAERGRASAAQGLAISTGVALQTGLVGAVVAWFGPAMDGPRFAALMTSGALVALVVAAGASRMAPARARQRGDAAPRPA